MKDCLSLTSSRERVSKRGCSHCCRFKRTLTRKKSYVSKQRAAFTYVQYSPTLLHESWLLPCTWLTFTKPTILDLISRNKDKVLGKNKVSTWEIQAGILYRILQWLVCIQRRDTEGLTRFERGLDVRRCASNLFIHLHQNVAVLMCLCPKLSFIIVTVVRLKCFLHH